MKLLTKKQLKEKVGYSNQHIDRLEKEKRFPLFAVNDSWTKQGV